MPQAVRHKSKPDRQPKSNLNKFKQNVPINTGAEKHYREILLFAFLFIALYLFISLVTYNPLDSGWGDGHAVVTIHNIGGRLGAIFSDNFFTWFGYFAYLFSFLVAYIGWAIYQNKHGDLLKKPKQLVIPVIGFILTLSAGCGLAIVHFAAESVLLPSHAGGQLGSLVGDGLKNISNAFGATLFLLIVFFAGFSMMTKLSWLWIMDRLGEKTLKWLPILGQNLYYHWLPKGIYFSKLSTHWLQVNFKKLWQQAQAQSQHWHNTWQQHQAQQINETVDQVAQHYLEPEPISTVSDKKPKNTPKLADSLVVSQSSSKQQLEQQIEQQLRLSLLSLNIEAHIRYIQTGPSLLHIELQSKEGEGHKLLNAQLQIAEALAIAEIRLYETAPDQVVLEIPNPEPEYIDLDDLLHQPAYTDNSSPLMLALGKDISGHPVIIDLARIPHLLLSGKNRLDMDMILDNMILSLIRKNSATQIRLLLLDSKDQCFNYFQDLSQLLHPIIAHDSTDRYMAFKWCVAEMERRYQLIHALKLRNIEDYNQAIRHDKLNIKTLPYLVIVVHELENLWQAPEVEQIRLLMTDLARKARSAGIHMLLSTANPSPHVISTEIKTNFPSRIIAQLADKTASQYLLGRSGAEYLSGHGDMLYLTPNTTGIPARLHAAQIQDDKAEQILAYARTLGKPQYQDLRIPHV